MATAIAAFFPTRSEGEAAFNALLEQGVTRDQVSFLTSEPGAHDVTAVGPKFHTGAESEAGTDAWVGGALGLAAGMIAFAIPGIGAVIAAGPLAGAIAGLSLGAAAGGIVGMLRDHGIPEEEAAFYEEGLRRGGALVTAHGLSEDESSMARDIFERNGAADIEKLAEEWRSTPHV
jgi:hypothetical protein